MFLFTKLNFIRHAYIKYKYEVLKHMQGFKWT